MTPEELAQGQLIAYNAHDLDAFLTFFNDSIAVFRPPQIEPVLHGKVEFAEFYRRERFCLPNLHAEVTNRMVLGNKVIDHEKITGLNEQVLEVAVVYEIRDGLIHTVWSFSADKLQGIVSM
ncbi:nuclear transport factor 2 family protein [Shewanella sp.]|uniref:nuclear transport factor 2 family protein n=1 Tax=Shewanella sp. TaxID=50422 RepID=UPI003562668A